jgi:hypothetical protein
MFYTIGGLPLHPLVVHAAVVLLPLGVLGGWLIALKSRWNRKFGFLVVGCAWVAAGFAFVAKESGEKLAAVVGTPTQHVSIARFLPYGAFGFALLVSLLWFLDRMGSDLSLTGRSLPAKLVAVATAVAGLALLWWVFRAGDSGATAVWTPIMNHATQSATPKP